MWVRGRLRLFGVIQVTGQWIVLASAALAVETLKVFGAIPALPFPCSSPTWESAIFSGTYEDRGILSAWSGELLWTWRRCPAADVCRILPWMVRGGVLEGTEELPEEEAMATDSFFDREKT